MRRKFTVSDMPASGGNNATKGQDVPKTLHGHTGEDIFQSPLARQTWPYGRRMVCRWRWPESHPPLATRVPLFVRLFCPSVSFLLSTLCRPSDTSCCRRCACLDACRSRSFRISLLICSASARLAASRPFSVNRRSSLPDRLSCEQQGVVFCGIYTCSKEAI